ncbi:GNAT family N-acetyltransferase [Bacillus sp. E(2018)]|uniref:GNAT family N-acetyltransferase n=1 Tax=Bacillus sp. E(2018) TaxID=2502239 RepID=UPI0010F67958|nr:GNAT family N-acetyltransferase [Bacillus sp. E(2018)]
MSKIDEVNVRVGSLDSIVKKNWNELVEFNGNAFQKYELIKIYEETWKGDFTPFHVTVKKGESLRSIIPGFLYRSCPRLDYYKRKIEPCIQDKILVSHDLVGWYGQPIFFDYEYLELSINKFIETANENNAMTFFPGIDSRNKVLLQVLKERGFEINHFHTIVARQVSPEGDPTLQLPKKKRSRVRNHIMNAKKAGLTTRFMKPEDLLYAVDMIVGILKEDGVESEVLPREMIHRLLNSHLEDIHIIMALDEFDIPIGVKVFVKNGNVLFGWLSGHDRSKLNKYRQSHFLYEEGIHLAMRLGCKEIQAGRSPYEVKLTHGYEPVAIFSAIKGSTNEQHLRATNWMNALQVRHRKANYERFHESYWSTSWGLFNEKSDNS